MYRVFPSTCRVLFLGLFVTSIVMVLSCSQVLAVEDAKELNIVVMDPLCAELACKCVNGYAQRDYNALARFIGKKLDRPVKVFFAADLGAGIEETPDGRVDIVIGKKTIVDFDSGKYKRNLKPIASLTGPKGTTTFTGMFVVPKDDPAKTIADLKEYRIFFGPKTCEEKHGAALAAMKEAKLTPPEKPEIKANCSTTVMDMMDIAAEDKKIRIAAVISSYAAPLLEGCGTIDPGSIRILGHTKPVPFITVYVDSKMDAATSKAVAKALTSVTEDKGLLEKLESQKGFLPVKEEKKK